MNVKAGDLAIVTGGFPRYIGIIVTVDRFIGEVVGMANCWQITAPQPVERISLRTGRVTHGRRAMIPDAWLRPVSGLPDTDTTLTEQPILKEVTA